MASSILRRVLSKVAGIVGNFRKKTIQFMQYRIEIVQKMHGGIVSHGLATGGQGDVAFSPSFEKGKTGKCG